MALLAFPRGVDVGAHRTFRPGILACEPRGLDVVDVGAAGTLVVGKPVSRAPVRAELFRKLPFETEVMLCDRLDLIRLATDHLFGAAPRRPDIVRFVSIQSKAHRIRPSVPITLPSTGQWLLRAIAVKKQFVFGAYRRQMKALRYLGQIDKLFGVPATTRNWNTIMAVVRILDRNLGTRR